MYIPGTVINYPLISKTSIASCCYRRMTRDIIHKFQEQIRGTLFIPHQVVIRLVFAPWNVTVYFSPDSIEAPQLVR